MAITYADLVGAKFRVNLPGTQFHGKVGIVLDEYPETYDVVLLIGNDDYGFMFFELETAQRCAECDGPLLEVDYLCSECRNKGC